ncbi:DUF3105 domain-containing protein [Nocardioides sp. GY 10113]|nr:DUF3105 domain-containing protein [Nocardioides sp. GY 10113]
MALGVVGGLLVLVIAIAVPAILVDGDGSVGLRPAGETRQAPADLDEVVAYDNLSRDHERGPIDYPQSPPVGGPHAPTWLDCGVYDLPVPAENLVHDLEHGTVVISYRPDAVDGDGVGTLAAQLPSNGILTPWPAQQAPVVITVWGRQLELTGVDDPRLPLFIAAYGHGETAPEPFASCAGGARPDQGRLA